MHLKHKIVLGLLMAFLFTACDKQRVYEKNMELGDGGWAQVNKLFFEVPVTDTVSLHNVYINVRNNDQYPYSNLFLFLDAEAPNGKKSRDTLEITLANNQGQWLGKSIGDIWDNSVLYRKNVSFPVKGTYKFTFEQAMRIKDLPLISDIGMRIEKVSN